MALSEIIFPTRIENLSEEVNTSRATESNQHTQNTISSRRAPKRSQSDFLLEGTMIANLLPSEATHEFFLFLGLFIEPSLLVTFGFSFCQKLGPVYSPNRPMLEFEVAVDRSNFIDAKRFSCKWNVKLFIHQKLIWAIRWEQQQMLRRHMLPIFTIMCYTHSSPTVQCPESVHCTETVQLYDCTLYGNYAHKSFLKQNFHISNMQKRTGRLVRASRTKKKPGELSTGEVNRRKALVGQSVKCTFYGELQSTFSLVTDNC